MTRRALVHALALSLVLSALLSSTVAAADPPPPKPSSMAAAGDSITRAFNLCFFPFSDCPARSWSTGNHSTVDSHARRLGITSSAFNDAVSGARMVDFSAQASTIASRNVDYVTVLMGGNDVCRDTEGQMTDPGLYEDQFIAGMNTIRDADADGTPPLVFVVSVPNVYNLWEILKDNSSARSAWNSYNICQSLLANPLSNDQADVDRRERVKQRNMELNQRLRAACASYTFCRFDGEGVFGTPFVPSDVSTRDYFHPSTDGQKKLAAVSFGLGYWADPEALLPVNDAPIAQFAAPLSCSVGVACTFNDESFDDGETMGGRSWQFGDGGTSTDEIATHTYASAGTFHVTLYAIDAAGATSSVTHPVEVVADGGGGGDTAPAAPAGLEAFGGDQTVDLSWSPNTEVDLAGYHVYRSTSSSGPFEAITGLLLETVTSYADSGLENGTTYHYVVTASDDAGNESEFSTSASATPSAPTGELLDVHVGDLDGLATRASRGNSWTATVTILVVDAGNAMVPGATVAGEWTTGGSSSCTTDVTGHCQVSVSLNAKKTSSTTFGVTSIAGDGLNYVSTSNADPDGDSDGTSITVQL